MKNLIINLTLILISSALVLVAAEWLLRLTPISFVLPGKTPRGYFVNSPSAGYDLARNFSTSTMKFSDGAFPIWTNELGCFDVPYHGEQPFIYLGGDSFTWGFARFEDKWGSRLQVLTGIRTVKCGVPGYGTRQQLIKATTTLSELPKPGLMLLMRFGNDVTDDTLFPNSQVYNGVLIKNLSGTSTAQKTPKELEEAAYRGRVYCMWNVPPHPLLQRAKCFLSKHSIAYIVSKNFVKKHLPRELLEGTGVVNENIDIPPALTDEGYEKHYANFRDFASYAKMNSIPFAVILAPSKELISGKDTSDNEKITSFLEASGIVYVNLLPGFKKATDAGHMLYWTHDGHWNAEGNRLAGLLVAQYVLTHGLISTADAQERLKTVADSLEKDFSVR